MDNSLDDITIVKQIQNDDASNLEILLQRHSGICYQQMHRTVPSGFLSAEMFESKDRIIYDAAKTFKFNKDAGFTTWLTHYTRYNCLDTLNSFSKYCPTDSEQINYILDSNVEVDREQKSLDNNLEVIRNVLDQISDKNVKKSIMLRYFSGPKVKTFKQVGKLMKVSHEAIRLWHKKFVNIARPKLQSKLVFDSI